VKKLTTDVSKATTAKRTWILLSEKVTTGVSKVTTEKMRRILLSKKSDHWRFESDQSDHCKKDVDFVKCKSDHWRFESDHCE
jgi:hypothetical protein